MPIALHWTPRDAPLPVKGVAGVGPVGVSLLQAALGRDGLRGVHGGGVVVLVGAADALPWVDGVVYLGHEPEAPELWWPTTLHPGVPARLLALAVRARATERGPLALLPSERCIVPLGDALPLTDDRVRRALGGAG